MGEPEDYLKNEEENDPARIQKESIELQREGLRLMKEQMAKANRTRDYVPATRYVDLEQRRKVMDFQVRKIENGYILAFKKDERSGIVQYNDIPCEVYCPTAEELVKAVADLVKAFTEEKAEKGAHAGYPPPFQLGPGESI